MIETDQFTAKQLADRRLKVPHTSVADAYRQHVKNAVEDAVLVERERCAKIADKLAAQSECDIYLCSLNQAAKIVAEEIRKEPK